MLLLLSPAKTLDYTTPLPAATPAATEPPFPGETQALVALLRRLSAAQLGALMGISPALAARNAQRFADWSPAVKPANARPALLAFDGDVYATLDARTLSADDLAWAQRHLAILSGLYGLLRPLDALQPYRLEMGTRLANPHGADLYRFWGPRIAQLINERLAADVSPVVVNLASQEYARAVDRTVLKAPFVDCVFEDFARGRWGVVGIHAKRARGLMARFAIERRAATPAQLQAFTLGGYRYDAAASQPARLVFRRGAPPETS